MHLLVCWCQAALFDLTGVSKTQTHCSSHANTQTHTHAHTHIWLLAGTDVVILGLVHNDSCLAECVSWCWVFSVYVLNSGSTAVNRTVHTESQVTKISFCYFSGVWGCWYFCKNLRVFKYRTTCVFRHKFDLKLKQEQSCETQLYMIGVAAFMDRLAISEQKKKIWTTNSPDGKESLWQPS